MRIARVRFDGATLFSNDELRVRVRTRANRRFLGIPGFTWWLWIYRFGDTLGGRVGRALMASGEPPATLDPTVLDNDVERLRLSFVQEGYRDAEVTARVDTARAAETARVTFAVEPNAPTYIRRVIYDGLGRLTPPQRDRLAAQSLLGLGPPVALDSMAFAAVGQRYSEPTLLEERRRLLTFLQNAGYARASRDSIRAIVRPLTSDSFDVTFRIRTGPRFRFGDIAFDVEGPEDAAAVWADTLSRVAIDAPQDSVLDVTARISGDGRLQLGVLQRTLRFTPGAWYSREAVLDTKRRLEATGLFAFTSILPTDTAVVAGDSAQWLPYRIALRTRPRHRVRLNTFMLQRNVQVEETGSELGAGAGVTYENANLLGNGEALRLSVTGSVAAADLSAPTSVQAEASATLAYPYLLGPFQRLERRLRPYNARSEFTLSWLTARRDELKLVIRGRGAARLRLEVQHTPFNASVVDVLDLSLSNPDTLADFTNTFLRGVLDRVDDPVQRAQLLEDYTRPQVNNALRYSFRSARVNPLRRERGYSREVTAELGGNLPYLLDRLVFTADTLEGSIPGIGLFRSSDAGSRLLYRQYVRLVADARRYRPLNRRTVFAWKALLGVAYPIGQANVVPFDRRFYSGGGGSVRGWPLRTLGPGGAADEVGGDGSTNVLGGDIKLEGSVEVRSVLLRNVFGAEWMLALFTDAGNVWFGPRNPGFGGDVPALEDGLFRIPRFATEVAVGSGLGLRIAWDYLVVRLDAAFRIHDPQDRGVFFSDRTPQLHFGIGHAF